MRSAEGELGPIDGPLCSFTAQTRMSGVDLNGFEIRKGRLGCGGELSITKRTADAERVKTVVEDIARSGGILWW